VKILPHISQLTELMTKEIDDFNYAIIHFQHLDRNLATAPAYGVYISQLSQRLQFVFRIFTTSPYSEC